MRQLFFYVVLLISVTCKAQSDSVSIFIDERDGQQYTSMKIGSQIWMTENLNFETANSWCFNDSIALCKKYGRLYYWQSAIIACPKGWHLPSDAEWNKLATFLGGTDIAGGKLKDRNEWKLPNNGASNSAKFNALPAGFRGNAGECGSIGESAYWWTATKDDSKNAWSWSVFYDFALLGRASNHFDWGYSVRCIMD